MAAAFVISEEEKFAILLSLLSAPQAAFIHTVTIDSWCNTKYSAAKELLITNYGLSRYERYESLFFGLSLGDMKPSQFLAKVLTFFDSDSDIDSLSQWLLLRQLPDDVKGILTHDAPNINTAAEMAQKADALMTARASRQENQHMTSAAMRAPSERFKSRPPRKLCSEHAKLGEAAKKCLGSRELPCPLW